MHPLGDIVKEFLLESHENLDRLDQDFVKLERSPSDRETLSAIFRVAHTLKSSSAFLGFKRLEALAHAGEHLLGRLRDGRLALSPDVSQSLLSTVDRLRERVREVEERQTDGDGDDAALIGALHALADGKPLPKPEAQPATPPARGTTSVAAAPTPGQVDELTREFLIETSENLDALDRSFVELEKDPGNREVLAGIFRTLHTIKGTSGFFGFSRLERLGHAAENLLGKLRTGELALAPEMTDVLLETADSIREVLRHVESTGREPETDHRELVECLNQLAGVTSSATALSRSHGTGGATSKADILTVRRAPHGESPEPPPRPAAPTPSAVPSNPSPAPAPAPALGDIRTASIADTSIRVDVGQLDKLMNLVGELVLARNRLMPFAANNADSAFVATTQVLNQITSELQERVMKTRMQPVSNLWSKLPRLVRDVAAQCGKQVTLEFEGQETELDRSLLEAIRDPLTHIVRNAVDHGIESPARREEAGKPAAGRLHLRAFHEGGQVVIEISDDGAGIDLGRIRNKAVEKGLLTAAAAEALSDRQAMELIFLPGFSTADKTTTVSGRGVGMDVVKTNIENIGGSLDLQTRAGQGTTLRLKVPLTLAIIPALLVGCCGERFAIPQTGLVELLRLGAEAEGGIEMVYGAPVVRLRGKLLPLVFLGNELQLTAPGANGNGSHAARKRTVNIVVLQAEAHRFGVVVDEVHDTEEIVVKPLGKLLKGVPCFAGGTILGDGRVALILDVVGLALHSGVVEKIRDRAFGDEEDEAPAGPVEIEQSLLIFDLGAGERMAIPIERITRLERFPVAQIEATGGGAVAKYHGEILPIVRANELIAGNAPPPEPEDGLFDVVVISERDRRVGMVVGRIQDIVSTPLKVQPWVGRRGLLGSAIVQNQVTSLVDVPGILREAAHLPNGDPAHLT